MDKGQSENKQLLAHSFRQVKIALLRRGLPKALGWGFGLHVTGHVRHLRKLQKPKPPKMLPVPFLVPQARVQPACQQARLGPGQHLFYLCLQGGELQAPLPPTTERLERKPPCHQKVLATEGDPETRPTSHGKHHHHTNNTIVHGTSEPCMKRGLQAKQQSAVYAGLLSHASPTTHARYHVSSPDQNNNCLRTQPTLKTHHDQGNFLSLP